MIKKRIWFHTTNNVFKFPKDADFEIPQIPEVYEWLNNTQGDIHIFENQSVLEHKNYKGFKIAYLRESPEVYDYTSQFGTPHITNWVLERHNEFDHIFSCFNYIRDIVGEDKFTFIPVGGSRILLKDYGLYEKERNISIVASFKDWTEGHCLRHQVIQKYQSQIEVYGSGYNEIIDKYDSNFGKIIAIAPYRYSLAIINSNKDDYFTDIIIDCLAVGTIPIFWGTKNITKYFNSEGIIQFNNIDDLEDILPKCNKKHYDSKIDAIKENIELAKLYSSTYDWIYKNVDFKKIIN